MKQRILMATLAITLAGWGAMSEVQAQWRGRGGNWNVGIGNGGIWYGQGYGNPYWNRGYYGGYNQGWRGYYGNPYSYQSGWNVGYGSPYVNYSIPSSSYYAVSGVPIYAGNYSTQVYSSNPCGDGVYQAGMVTSNTGSQAMLRIQLPDPQARVWIQNTLMSQQGAERLFQSPPLEATKDYQYTVKAVWRGPDNQEVTREKVVDVRAGQESVLNFMEDRNAAAQRADSQVPMPSIQPPQNERRSGYEVDPRRSNDPRPSEDRPRGNSPFTKEAVVVAVQDNSLTVREADGDRQQVLVIKDDVAIRQGEQAMPLRDLKEGQRVRLTFQGEGVDRKLTLVEVRPLAAAP